MLVCGASAFAQTQRPKVADLYAAIREEDHGRAKALAKALSQDGLVADQQAALLLFGRALLGSGDLAEAESYLAKLAGMQLDDNGTLLVRVYRAWLKSLKGEPQAAMKSLDEILAAQMPVAATAEAAKVLARIHVTRGDSKAAAQAIGFGRKFLAYHEIKSDYLESLFRRRLNPALLTPKDEAQALFDRAEALRLAGKATGALVLYDEICKKHARSPWADPAGFRVGQCLLLSGKGEPARKQWQAFVREKPKGSWRAQAYVALADIALEYDFDPTSALEYADDATRVLSEGVDEAAKESWAKAAFDVHLRQACAAMLSEKFADAAVAFRLALSAAPDQEAHASDLGQLVAMAEEPRQAAPQQVLGGPCGSLLCLARIYNLAALYDKAALICTRLIKGEVRGCSPAQKAYAIYETAFSLDRMKKAQEARKEYLLSLKTYREGAWHDDTLFRAAMLTQEIAADLPAAAQRGGKSMKPNSLNAGGPADRAQQRERNRREQSTADSIRLQGRSEALPLWTQLIQSFPKSQHRDAALYCAGLLYFEIGRPSESFESLSELVTQFPDSVYAGDARVKLADVCIESLFDVSAAKTAVDDGLAWLERRQPLRAGFGVAADGAAPPLRPVEAIEFDLRIRAGLVAYLEGRHAEALAHFESARPFEPVRKLVVVSGHIPGAVERLISAAKAGKPLVPDEVEVGDTKASLCLRVASLYFEAEDFDHSIRLCNRLLDGMPKATRDQRSWAYFLRGRCFHGQHLPLEGADSFAKAADETVKASWKPTSLFYMANAVFNYERDAPTAIALWQRIAREFPASAEAERGQYYVGFALMHSGKHREARAAFDAFLKARPGSVYERAIRSFHYPRLDELEAAGTVSVETKGQP